MATPTITTKPRATAPAARMSPHTARRGMFVLEDGRNVVFTFFLLVFLFALWGFCNGMIDVMDKHFQEELHLNLAQSAWVQFAHYLGYFLMAIPAGWLAIKLGGVLPLHVGASPRALLAFEPVSVLYAARSGWLRQRLSVYGFFLRPASWRYLRTKRRAVQMLRRRGDRDLLPFLASRFRFGPVATPAVRFVLDPVFAAYWSVVSRLIAW
jgi:FHS family L-fucose permease-like MFS transporter